MAPETVATTDGEFAVFVDKLGRFRATLGEREQHLLDAMLVAAAHQPEGDVQGYALSAASAKQLALAAVVALGIGAGTLVAPGGTALAAPLEQPMLNGNAGGGRSGGGSTSGGTTNTQPTTHTTTRSGGTNVTANPQQGLDLIERIRQLQEQLRQQQQLANPNRYSGDPTLDPRGAGAASTSVAQAQLEEQRLRGEIDNLSRQVRDLANQLENQQQPQQPAQPRVAIPESVFNAGRSDPYPTPRSLNEVDAYIGEVRAAINQITAFGPVANDEERRRLNNRLSHVQAQLTVLLGQKAALENAAANPTNTARPPDDVEGSVAASSDASRQSGTNVSQGRDPHEGIGTPTNTIANPGMTVEQSMQDGPAQNAGSTPPSTGTTQPGGNRAVNWTP
jgi:hypothetical protein